MQLRTSSIIIVAILCLFACEKDKFETVPKISFKSIGPGVVYAQDRFKITINFEDKEGDVTSDITVIRRIINQRYDPQDPNYTMVMNFPIPAYPASQSGELNANFIYGASGAAWESNLPGAENENDTCIFTIFVKDAAGNKSNELVSDKIVFMLPPK